MTAGEDVRLAKVGFEPTARGVLGIASHAQSLSALQPLASQPLHQAHGYGDSTIPGWFHHGPQILALLEQHKPLVCVELGTWLGASAIPVARSIARWRGMLTCVDTWSDDIYQAGETSPWVLVSCARNLIAAGLSNVRLHPSTTLEAARCWTEPIDYLYVDADHHYDAVLADLDAWVPHVKPGGLIVGDDYRNHAFPGVKQAWDEFEAAHGLRLTRYQSDPPHPDGVQLIYGTV